MTRTYKWRGELPPPEEWQTVGEYATEHAVRRHTVDSWISRGRFAESDVRVFPVNNQWGKCRMVRTGTLPPSAERTYPKAPELVEQLELSLRAAGTLQKSGLLTLTVDELTAHTESGLTAAIHPDACGSGSVAGVVAEIVDVLSWHGLALRSDSLRVDDTWAAAVVPDMTPKRLCDELVSGLSFAGSDNPLWRKVGTRNTARALACFYAIREGHATPADAFGDLAQAFGNLGPGLRRRYLSDVCSGAHTLETDSSAWRECFAPLASRVVEILRTKIERAEPDPSAHPRRKQRAVE